MSINGLGLLTNNMIPIEDKGIILSPAADSGDPMYRWDSCGMREAIINKVGNTYYMFYDGASNFDHDPTASCGNGYNHLWRTCLATSTDLVNWTKQGVKLNTSYDEHPTNIGYMDWATATSPWVYFNSDDNYWYMYYLGCTSVNDEGVPTPTYVTLTAKAATAGLNGIGGSWNKMNDIAGQANHLTIRLPKGDGSYPTEGVSPGHVIQNPKWTGSSDTVNKRYMMFATSSWGINICRTDDLSATDASTNTATHQGWQPGSTEIFGNNGIAQNPYNAENASYYYDETTEYHYLFTNHILNADHTDGFYVNWTKDSDNWDPANRALLMSSGTNTCTWSTGAIGMPSVVKVDDSKLALVYDAVQGSGTGHLHRKIGLAYLSLPLVPVDHVIKTDSENS